MKRRIVAATLICVLGASLLAGCGNKEEDQTTKQPSTTPEVSAEPETPDNADQLEATTINIFAAASLNTVMEDLIKAYNEKQPNVTIVGSYDSSGTLLTQIEEGAECDVFFSAAQKQMDTLQNDDGMVVEGTRYNVVNNQVCVVTYKDSDTKVTGLDTIKDASSFALADGSVPVGKYTRQAFVNAGILPEAEDVSKITTQEVSDALGGIEINECANVSAVAAAVSEGANEVGTVYKSDTYGLEDKLDILEIVPYDLTGNVIYPVAQVANPQADELRQAAAKDFVEFLISDEAKTIFEAYYFDTNVEN